MSVEVVKFNVQDRPEFFKELRSRVNKHFKDNNLSKHGNLNMKIKTIFMVSMYFIPLALILTGVISTFWTCMAMWALMGVGMAGIGLSVTHDANHGSYSKNKRTNQMLGLLLNCVGGYNVNWKIQHNVLHHSFTNIEEFDEDIRSKLIRFSHLRENRFIYKFQAFYAPFVYGLLTMYWILLKDFDQLFRFNKKNLLEGQGVSITSGLMHIVVTKVIYFIVTWAIPFMIMDLPWWQLLIGFATMQYVSGLILAFIFQPAHVFGDSEFYAIEDDEGVENSWAIHQLKTTSNCANESVWFTWFVGGLNFQIEHHLFPHICHVHYSKIAKIVKETAAEYDVPYHQHKTFWQAVVSHLSLLNTLGNGRDPEQVIKQKLAA